jgi:release factor glutamine methyltransferase
VLATDISPAAVALAEQNAAAHGVAERVRCRVADLLTPPDDCDEWRQCDVITANPPYVPDGEGVAEEVRHEPAVAVRGGKDGLDFIRRIVGGAGRFLPPGGSLVMEFGHGQADAVRDLIVAAGDFDEPRILRDHQGMERAARTEKR